MLEAGVGETTGLATEEDNLKKLRSQRRVLEEEAEMKRQVKLAEMKMKSSLLKNKDFRKILKTYLKKTKITH